MWTTIRLIVGTILGILGAAMGYVFGVLLQIEKLWIPMVTLGLCSFWLYFRKGLRRR